MPKDLETSIGNIQKEIGESFKLKKIAELLNSATTVIREEYPDKITWGPASSRNEFRFNSSNEQESLDRLKNFKKIQEESEKIGGLDLEEKPEVKHSED